MLLLHAILPADTVTAPTTGLRGWPLREIRVSDVAAWATACAQQGFSPGREDLLAQHALVERALGASLPVRFPTCFADEAAVRELLERRHGELESALKRVRGRVELAVTITWSDGVPAAEAPSLATTPGRRFLEERRQQYAAEDERRAEARRLAALIEADERVLEAQHKLSPGPDIALSSALLVGLDDVVAVEKWLQGLEEGVRILVNGPWPPYTFASLEG